MCPTSTPRSKSTVRCAGVPSSSTPNEPHAPTSVPSSTIVTSRSRTVSPRRFGVDARVLHERVGFEPVTAGLVDQHAAGAGREHDRELPGRRGLGVEHPDRLAGGLRAQLCGRELLSSSSNPPECPGASNPVAISPFARRDHLDGEADPRAVVLGQTSVRRCDRGPSGGRPCSVATTWRTSPPVARAASSAAWREATLSPVSVSSGATETGCRALGSGRLRSVATVPGGPRPARAARAASSRDSSVRTFV